MQNWPPVKAWTNLKMSKYDKYFVAVNYGVSNNEYWVKLVSLIDGHVCFYISFESLKDTSVWSPGWEEDLGDLEVSCDPKKNGLTENKSGDDKCCLHPSDDSGLNFPINQIFLRPWYPD